MLVFCVIFIVSFICCVFVQVATNTAVIPEGRQGATTTGHMATTEVAMETEEEVCLSIRLSKCSGL